MVPLVTQPTSLVALIDLHSGPHDAPVQQGDGRDPPGQGRQVGEVPVHIPDKGPVLALQGGPADEITLLGGEAHGELGQGHGEDGDLAAVGGNAHLVAVQGEDASMRRVSRAPRPAGRAPSSTSRFHSHTASSLRTYTS